jgi:hypothetical protein
MNHKVMEAYMYLLTLRDPKKFQYWGPSFLPTLIRSGTIESRRLRKHKNQDFPSNDECDEGQYSTAGPEASRGYDYKHVTAWSKKAAVVTMDLEKLFLPVHFEGTGDTAAHWVLAVINIKQKRFEWHDPARNETAYPHAEILSHLRQFLFDEAAHYSPGSEYAIAKWPVYIARDAPIQADNTSCGLFTCLFAEILGTGELLTTSSALEAKFSTVLGLQTHVLNNLLAAKIL